MGKNKDADREAKQQRAAADKEAEAAWKLQMERAKERGRDKAAGKNFTLTRFLDSLRLAALDQPIDMTGARPTKGGFSLPMPAHLL